VIFPSYGFLLLFLPVTLLLWHYLRGRTQLRLLSLTLMSYVFYGWWDARFVTLLVASTVIDYWAAQQIVSSPNPRVRRTWLALSLCGNLGVLGIFKYFDFFMNSAQSALHWIGVDVQPPLLHVVLPLGISFYTFHSLSYTYDIYKGTSRPAKDLLHYAAYIAMFPHLVAGPIVRYAHIEEQLRVSPLVATPGDEIAEGIWLFVIGVVKKIWIADLVAPMVNVAFDGSGTPNVVVAWAGVLAYPFQLYFDFSGYTDMARGLGKLIGFNFPINFDSPYKSANISDFWNRWHITLSNFLRDYVFIPLGGSRDGMKRTVRNLLITMFLGGLWHGAGWTFILWGTFHGAMLATHAVWRSTGRKLPQLPSVAITFACVSFGWILFRAPSMARFNEVLRGLVGLGGPISVAEASHWLQLNRMECLSLLFAMTVAFLAPNSQQLPKPTRPIHGFALAAVLLATMTTFMKETPFLYFQF
jgi:alginate O-acetyltransferase complex protein AlgI